MNKLNQLLTEKGIGRDELYREILRLFPNNPVTKAQLSRIKNGNTKYYSTHTLIRICRALRVTPNDVLDFEKK